MDDRLDFVLRALADRTRRALLDRLRDTPGLTLGELFEGFPQSRQALSKHLTLLEDCELVVPVWRGREKRHYLNPAPLQALPARWITESKRDEEKAASTMREAVVTSPDGSAQSEAKPNERKSKRSRNFDDIADGLQKPPHPELQGQPIMQASGLQAAREYLAETATLVEQLIAAMSPEDGYAKPSKDRFSLVEHLWHLADIETLGWKLRFERILNEVKPKLDGVDGDRLAMEKRYGEQPWRAAARRFVAERKRSLRYLEAFDPDVLKRPVVFAGARTRAGGVLAAAVAHDFDHRPEMATLWNEIAASRNVRRRR
jgi:DNA-binding transcriptional ArsR family regulator